MMLSMTSDSAADDENNNLQDKTSAPREVVRKQSSS